MSLRDISTNDLVKTLSNRPGVKSMDIKANEYYRVKAASINEERERYINVPGKAKILIVDEEKAKLD
ncbi:MAG: hypothetical protein GX275_05940 [Clostridiales bacterium]|nr:hypothetical protein [Clostridiales bacterium]